MNTVSKIRDDADNEVYTLESGVHRKLDQDGKSSTVLKVAAKDIILDANNPHAKLEISFEVGVGKSDKRRESREEVKAGIFNQLEEINRMLTGNSFGTSLPGFSHRMNEIADQLTKQVLKLQDAQSLIDGYNGQISENPSLEELEEWMKLGDGVVYLPDLVGR